MDYRGHLVSHVGSRPFSCGVCGERFNHPVSLYSHYQKLHYQPSTTELKTDPVVESATEPEKNLIASEKENKEGSNETDEHEKGNNLYEEDEDQISEEPPSSSNCSTISKEEISDQLYEEKNDKDSTENNKSSETFDCKLCSKFFTRIQDLKRHINTVHSVDKSQICDICGKVIGKREAMAKHLLVHQKASKGFHCSVCGKAYARKASLVKHKCQVKKKVMPQVDEMSEETASFLINITKAMEAIPLQPSSASLANDQFQSQLKRINSAVNEANALITNTIGDFSTLKHSSGKTELTSCLIPLKGNPHVGDIERGHISQQLPLIDGKTIDNILGEISPVDENIEVTKLFEQELSSCTTGVNNNQGLKEELIPSAMDESTTSLIDRIVGETSEPNQALDVSILQPVVAADVTKSAESVFGGHEVAKTIVTQSMCELKTTTTEQVTMLNDNETATQFGQNNTVMIDNSALVDYDTIVDVCGETDKESVSSSQTLSDAAKSDDNTMICSATLSQQSQISKSSPENRNLPENTTTNTTEEKTAVIRRSKRKIKASTRNSSKIFILGSTRINRQPLVLKTQSSVPTPTHTTVKNNCEVPAVEITSKIWSSDNLIEDNNDNDSGRVSIKKHHSLPLPGIENDQTALVEPSAHDNTVVGDTIQPTTLQNCDLCNKVFFNDMLAFQMHLRGHVKDCRINVRKCDTLERM